MKKLTLYVESIFHAPNSGCFYSFYLILSIAFALLYYYILKESQWDPTLSLKESPFPSHLKSKIKQNKTRKIKQTSNKTISNILPSPTSYTTLTYHVCFRLIFFFNSCFLVCFKAYLSAEDLTQKNYKSIRETFLETNKGTNKGTNKPASFLFYKKLK